MPIANGSGSPLLAQAAGFERANPKYSTELIPPSFRLHMPPLGHFDDGAFVHKRVERCAGACAA